MRTVGVLLAAGRSVRFGSDKLLAPFSTTDHAATTVAAASCRTLVAALPESVAVVRPGAEALEAQLAAAGASVVRCVGADAGMSATLACGILAALDADGWVIALADMPWVRVDTLCAVADALQSGARIAAPFYRGARGHPVGFAQAMRAELLLLKGDEGARALLRVRAGDVERVEVDDPGILRDVDVPADLQDYAER